MATSLDYEYVEDVPEELSCSICFNVLCKPHMVNCCEQQFCKTCLDKWLRRDQSCPHCRSTNFSTILLKQKSRRAEALKVYCPNKRHGCKAELKVSGFQSHLSAALSKGGCPYALLDCPYNCKAKLFRCEMKTHRQAKCPRRSAFCSHCNTQGEYRHIVGSHIKKCLFYPLPCPLECGAVMPRKDCNAHRSTCPKEPVLCPFSSLGCKAKVCRGDLQSHVETGVSQHMTMLMKSHAALQAEHVALKTGELASLKAEHAKLETDHATLETEHASLKGDLVALKTQHAEELATLKIEHATLNSEHAALKDGCVMKSEYTVLKSDHATLQMEHEALKKSHYAKLEAVGSVLRNTPDPVIAKLYTVLVDITTLTFRDSLSLGFAEDSATSGHHYIVLSQDAPKHQYKFKLKWKLVEVEQRGIATRLLGWSSRQSYRFEVNFLLVVQDIYPALTADTKFDIAFRLDDGVKSSLKVCCTKPGVSDGSVIGKLAVNCLKMPQLLKMQFLPHDLEQCSCLCHHDCMKCGLRCNDNTSFHVCCHCGNMCHRHHCFQCSSLCTETHHSCSHCGEYYLRDTVESVID